MDGSMTDGGERALVRVRLPVWWTLAGLVGGLAAGALIGRPAEPLALVGTLWLRGLQMTIIPLVTALLVLGITRIAAAARAGATARRFLAWIGGLLLLSGLASVLAMPALLAVFPAPDAAGALLSSAAEPGAVPEIGEFLASLIAPNIVAAAAETAMLPLTLFVALFALAVSRLPGDQRERLVGFFHALANAMLIVIGWVLWLAPAGVFALAYGVAARAGGEGAFAALGHYILTVSAMGAIVLVAAYCVAIAAARLSPLRFARALLPAQVVAASTQSSLATLPAMLDSARRLDVRPEVAGFALPLAVAVFRATSPGMNLAVAIYVAHLAGVVLTPGALAAGIAVALVISVGSVSLPGSISFVVSIGPVALAMGVPIEPLALLVAVEMLPDIMRTLANVTTNVAVTAAIDRAGAVGDPGSANRSQ